jgi:hypothetical protein
VLGVAERRPHLTAGNVNVGADCVECKRRVDGKSVREGCKRERVWRAGAVCESRVQGGRQRTLVRDVCKTRRVKQGKTHARTESSGQSLPALVEALLSFVLLYAIQDTMYYYTPHTISALVEALLPSL